MIRPVPRPTGDAARYSAYRARGPRSTDDPDPDRRDERPGADADDPPPAAAPSARAEPTSGPAPAGTGPAGTTRSPTVPRSGDARPEPGRRVGSALRSASSGPSSDVTYSVFKARREPEPDAQPWFPPPGAGVKGRFAVAPADRSPAPANGPPGDSGGARAPGGARPPAPADGTSAWSTPSGSAAAAVEPAGDELDDPARPGTGGSPVAPPPLGTARPDRTPADPTASRADPARAGSALGSASGSGASGVNSSGADGSASRTARPMGRGAGPGSVARAALPPGRGGYGPEPEGGRSEERREPGAARPRPTAPAPGERPPVAPPSEARSGRPPSRSPSHDRVRAALRDVPWETLATSDDRSPAPDRSPGTERSPMSQGPIDNPYGWGGVVDPADPLGGGAMGLDDDEIWEPDETDGPELEIDPAELGEAPDHRAYRFRLIEDADIEDAEVVEDPPEFGGFGDVGFGPVRSLAGEPFSPYDTSYSSGLGSSGLGLPHFDPLGPAPLGADPLGVAGPSGPGPRSGSDEFAESARWDDRSRFEAGRREARRYAAAGFETRPDPVAVPGAGPSDDREANLPVEPTEPARPGPENAFAYGPRTTGSSGVDPRPAFDPADRDGDQLVNGNRGWDDPGPAAGPVDEEPAPVDHAAPVDEPAPADTAEAAAGESPAPAGPADAALAAAVAALSDRVDELVRLRRHDAELVDKLHAENSRLRQGELTEAMAPLLRGLMRLHDQMASIARDDTESVAGLLRNQLLQSLDLAADMRPYTAVPGMPFDPTRHLGVRRVPTEDSGLDRTVARTVKPGFVRGQTTVVRPAEVEVYRAN